LPPVGQVASLLDPALPTLGSTTPTPAPLAPLTPVTFPIGWLLEHAASPIKFRAYAEVARLTMPSLSGLAALPYEYRPALFLALTQSPDGTWFDNMLEVPSSRETSTRGVGTINAVRRLLEYGWDREAPPLVHARRALFRILAEDDDPSFLYELAPKGGSAKEPELTRLLRVGLRVTLREAAAAALAQAGYEGDPRLRGAAQRIVRRIGAFLRSPLAKKPWIRVGNKQVLAPEATPPSIYVLSMLAHMPLFRSEHHEVLDRIYNYLSEPLPRQDCVQLVGKKIVSQPHLILGDMLPTRNAVDADVPFALCWLELVARLGFIRRNEGWSKMFERLLDDRDRAGIWHPHKGMAMPRSTNPFVWAMFPLEHAPAGEDRWTDVTFRLGLIARLSGRPINLV
jgi:hypothetical protein